ncbi:MAG: hypothetical protein R3F56_06230 [Planctomycetota bacterium]
MRSWFGLACIALAVGLGVWLRVHTAFASGLFDGPAEGVVRADPGTLWYLLQRFIAGGGWPDASFAADVHVEHPAVVDCWSTFTVGHELLLAQLHFVFPGVPLHRLCTVALASSMSLCALGVFALARAMSRRTEVAALAALLFALTPAAYRTIGFVLMNEDTSLPWLAAHLGAGAWAMNRCTPARAVLAALLAVLAAATWHATTLLLGLELGCVLLWSAWSGRPPLRRRAALAFVLTLSVTSLLVPALRAKGFAFGLPVQLVSAIMVAHAGARWPRAVRVAVALGAAALLALGGSLLGNALGSGHGDFRHVFELLLAKLVHLGRFPDDPATLSFDARIMWQGPFASMGPLEALRAVGPAVMPAVAWAAVRTRRAPRHEGAAAGALPLLLGTCLVATLLVNRMQVLAGLLVPVAAAASTTLLAARLRLPAAVGLIAVQAIGAGHFFATLELSWHARVRRLETMAALDAVRDLTPPDAAIAADPVLGGAVLAHTGRRIAVPAKWEDAESRARMHSLLEPFLRGSVADMHRTLRDELRCGYFLVDRQTLWGDCRQMGGISRQQPFPLPGTAAEAFCTDDLLALQTIPGFRLLYRSPTSIRYDDGAPAENVRLFRVLP